MTSHFVDSWIYLLIGNSKFKEKNISRYEKTIIGKENRLKQIDGLIQSLFEEKLSGNVPENIFKRMAKKYDDERLQLDEELSQLKIELADCQKTEKDITAWIKKIKKCLSVENLSRTIVVELIDSIEVSKAYTMNGEAHQDINIKFKFQDCKRKKKEQAKGFILGGKTFKLTLNAILSTNLVNSSHTENKGLSLGNMQP